MKKTGVTRKLDELGRIVIPKEIRNNFRIEEGDQIEFYLNNNEIIIKKPSPLKGLDDEIHKLFQTYNLKFHNSIAIIENGSLLIGYGKDLNKITNSLSEININQYTSKNLMRYKNNENNFIICNITNNKYLILTEEKTSTTLDSTVINLILDYLIKLLKEE
jgi:AbrB family looped-hinge helix DNA binding protein